MGVCGIIVDCGPRTPDPGPRTPGPLWDSPGGPETRDQRPETRRPSDIRHSEFRIIQLEYTF